MPSSNANTVVGVVGVIVVSVAAAAAVGECLNHSSKRPNLTSVAIYESPELRQFAEDCRRKIAIALHSLGDEINPQARQPRFNRPEDAEGFMRSSADPGLDGDEESRRKQREELMYWNQVRLEKEEREAKERAEESVEKSAEATNTGTDLQKNAPGLLHRRTQGNDAAQRGAFYASPFADENHIEMEDVEAAEPRSTTPQPSESDMTDCYDLEPLTPKSSTRTMSAHQDQDPLVDLSETITHPVAEEAANAWSSNTSSSATEAHPDAWASIHAWANNSNSEDISFYSPIPVSPQVARSAASEPSHISGDLTPTDSASIAGSGEDIANESSVNGSHSHYYDVVSDDEAGINTPGSWTEVGSVVSEAEH